MILYYGKKSLFWSLIIFGYLNFTTVRGQKNGFQQLWMYKVFKRRKLPWIPCLRETHIKLQWYSIFLHFFRFFAFATQLSSTPARLETSTTKLRLLQGTAVTHNPWLRDPRRLNDKLALLCELHQARHIHSHFQFIFSFDVMSDVLQNFY